MIGWLQNKAEVTLNNNNQFNRKKNHLHLNRMFLLSSNLKIKRLLRNIKQKLYAIQKYEKGKQEFIFVANGCVIRAKKMKL